MSRSLLVTHSFCWALLEELLWAKDIGSMSQTCKGLRDFFTSSRGGGLKRGARVEEMVKELFDQYRQQQCFDCFVKGNEFKNCGKVFGYREFKTHLTDIPFYSYVN